MNRDSEGHPIRVGDLVLGEYGVIVALGPSVFRVGLRMEFFYVPYSRTTLIRELSPGYKKRVIAR